jgi:hypothetical protein
VNSVMLQRNFKSNIVGRKILLSFPRSFAVTREGRVEGKVIAVSGAVGGIGGGS